MKRRKRQRGDHAIPHAIVKCGVATKNPGAQGLAGAHTIAVLALCAIVDGDGAARFDVPSLCSTAKAQTRPGVPAIIWWAGVTQKSGLLATGILKNCSLFSAQISSRIGC